MKPSELKESLYTCASCGYCRFGCPVFQELALESTSARGKIQLLKRLLEGQVTFEECKEALVEALFMCAECEHCKHSCPTGINFAEIAGAVKEELYRQGHLPELQATIRQNVLEKGNPYGSSIEDRSGWLPKNYKEPKESEILFFAGCVASFPLNRTAKSVIKIFEAIGLDFTTLGSQEFCCGRPLAQFGDPEGVRLCVAKNVEKFQQYGVKHIIAGCAGCFKTLLHEYPKQFQYSHITQFLNELAKEGRLEYKKDLKEKIVYFDGCDIGRHCHVYEEPREFLRSIPGVELVELDYNREEVVCCGGPLTSSFPTLSENIAAKIVKEAADKGATMLATPCPACFLNFKAGARVANVKIDIKDIPMILPTILKKPKKK